jgi:4-methyl-5(b-hydroxyethyl)-thiazole monophosphate biosynthesis
MRAIVPLADGFEEIEAVSIIDLLRRARIEVTVAGVHGMSATGSHGITMQCDALVEDCDFEGADALVLPGGMPGSRTLRDSEPVRDAVTRFASDGKLVAAICAAPTVLSSCGVLRGRRATSHPAHAYEMDDCSYVEDAVVEDGNIITSRGAGTSIEFALAVIARLVNKETAREIADRIVHRS